MGIKRQLRNSQAQAGRLADQVARLNRDLQVLRDEKIEALEVGIVDLHNHPGERVTVITPGGKLISGLVLSLVEEAAGLHINPGQVIGGLRSVELRIGLTP